MRTHHFMGHPRQGTQPPAGFTLVELLTVIFIIGLLVVMISPTYEAAKESARNTLCQNNLEKLSAALRVPAGGDSYVSLPEAGAWMPRAMAGGAEPCLKCPKGYFQGGVSGFAAKPNVEITDPPMSAVFDAPIPDIEDNDIVWAWTERVNYVLPADVRVDITQPGRWIKDYAASSKTIPAGTAVNCYFLHFDAVDKGPAETQGEAVFGSDILGIICVSKSHDAVDDILGAPGTTYHTGRASRGFESGQDCVILQPDMRTLTIERYYVTSPGEDVRVLTAPCGEASYAMNNQVKPLSPAPGQLLLVEYNKPVADVDGRGHGDDDLAVELAPRHFGRVNTLLVDGSVRLRWPDQLEANQPIWRP